LVHWNPVDEVSPHPAWMAGSVAALSVKIDVMNGVNDPIRRGRSWSSGTGALLRTPCASFHLEPSVSMAHHFDHTKNQYPIFGT
jgi:hypothetical protein